MLTRIFKWTRPKLCTKLPVIVTFKIICFSNYGSLSLFLWLLFLGCFLYFSSIGVLVIVVLHSYKTSGSTSALNFVNMIANW